VRLHLYEIARVIKFIARASRIVAAGDSYYLMSDGVSFFQDEKSSGDGR
jgi:hypothetical protein